MHKFRSFAALLGVALFSSVSNAFDADGWYEHWQTPDFELRFNYFRGDDMVLHTRNAAIICADGRHGSGLSDEEVASIFSPLWDAINEFAEQDYNGLPHDDARVTDPERAQKLYHLRYYDPAYGTKLDNYYDFSGNKALLNTLRKSASKLCDKK